MKKLRRIHPSFSLRRTATVLGFAAVMLMPANVMADNSAAPNQPASAMQAKAVKGHVVDEFGEPMIGVTVKVDGTVGGVISDLDGNFSITLPNGKKSITLSYAGYKTKTVQVSGSSVSVTMTAISAWMHSAIPTGLRTRDSWN